MSTSNLVKIALAVFAVVIFYNISYIVTEKEFAVKLRFGQVEDDKISPGLHFKIPVMNRIIKLDGRILTVSNPSRRYITNEKKTLIVDSYIMWRISNVRQFYVSTSGDELVARRLLGSRVDNGLRDSFGKLTLNQVVSGERNTIMINLIKTINEVSAKDLGVEVIDIRIKRIDLPEEVSESVFNRMRSGREREARELRSTGKEAAEEIRATADKDQLIIASEAKRKSEVIRGNGDALAAKIYANAYNRDLEFYSFVRTLNAYKESFNSKSDLMILNPTGKFFKHLR